MGLPRGRARLPGLGASARQGLAAAGEPPRTLSLTGTVKADGSIVAGDMAEVEGEPRSRRRARAPSRSSSSTRAAPCSRPATSRQPRHGPDRRRASTGDEHAVTPDAAFSLRVPAVAGARDAADPQGRPGAVGARALGRGADRRRHLAGRRRARSASATDMTVTWNAADADGDALTHFVAVSTDGGGTWKTLGDGVTGSSLTVKTGLELNGEDVRVRVTTTDGWNTGHRRLRAVLDAAGSSPTGRSSSTTGAGRDLDRDDRRRRREADRRPRPPPALVARRHQARVGQHGPATPPSRTAATTRRSRPSQDATRAPLWADEDTLIAKLENADPGATSWWSTATGAATEVDRSKFAELCDVVTGGTKVLGRYGALRGLVVDLELCRRQGRRAARGEVLRRVLPRRALRGRHARTAATRTRASTSSSTTSRPRRSATSPTATSAATTRTRPGRRRASRIVWGSNKDRSGSTGFGATDLWRIRPDGTDAKKIVDGKAFGNAGTGFMNFEAPDVSRCGASPGARADPRGAQARREGRRALHGHGGRGPRSTPRPRRPAPTARRSRATPGTSTATAPTTTPPARSRRRASRRGHLLPSPCR